MRTVTSIGLRSQFTPVGDLRICFVVDGSRREQYANIQAATNQGRRPQIPISCEQRGARSTYGSMPRIARVVAVGLPHHVTQRGNNRRRIFDSDEDRIVYLKLLQEYAGRRGLVIWGYCLMDNHVHLIAAPQREDALARTLRQAHGDYARYANVKRRTSGHFWQNRYFSCALDGNHCWTALAYVERNPVRAGLTREAGEWRWSSAQWHVEAGRGCDWLDFGAWRKRYTPEQWREVLRTTVGEEAQAERIREATTTGRPMGAPEFVHDLERQLLRRLTPGKVGRPARGASEDMVQAEEIGI